MSFAMILALTACSGGDAGKGEKKEKGDFESVAAQRVRVAESGFTKASMKMKHQQKVGSQKANYNYSVTYQLSSSLEWQVVESDISSAQSGYEGFINFTMDKAEQFLTALKRMAENAAPTYYVAETASTLEVSGTADAANMKGKVSATANWNEYGMLTKWHEKDDFSEYQGYKNVIIEETLTYTYSK